MEKELAKRLLERVRRLRQERGLTQESLAEQAGLDYKHYQAIEAGRRMDFRISTLAKLAKGLGVEAWELLIPLDMEPAVAEAQAKYVGARENDRERIRAPHVSVGPTWGVRRRPIENLSSNWT